MGVLRLSPLLLLAAASGLVGCGGTDRGKLPDTVPAKGTVTYKGTPVTGATVTFVADGEAPSAFGKTDESGSFELTSFNVGKGAVPGQYRVTITKYTDSEPADVASVESDDYVPPELGTELSAGPTNLVPEKFAKPETSELTATVTEDGENDFKFDLTD